MFDSQISIHSAHQFPSLAAETTTANDAIRLRYGIGSNTGRTRETH
jgi:hypothetical protein